MYMKFVWFLNKHFSLIQSVICLTYLLGWKTAVQAIFPQFVSEMNYTVDLLFVFIELMCVVERLETIYHSNKTVGKLGRRSTTLIEDCMRTAENDIFISGIINNGALHTILNNPDLVNSCIRRKIKFHVLFYVPDKEENFDWYLKMMYGFDEYRKSIPNDKRTYGVQLKYFNDGYDEYRALKEHNLISFKKIDTPITTAFVAKDIYKENPNGLIQCLFYQFKIDSPNCPAYTLQYGDDMFSEMQQVIKDMWDSAYDELDVDYISIN